MHQSEVILKKAILAKDKLEKLLDRTRHSITNLDTMISKLNDPNFSKLDDSNYTSYGSLPLPGTSDLTQMAHNADKTVAVLEALIFQAMGYND